jgi:hypothetical protein
LSTVLLTQLFFSTFFFDTFFSNSSLYMGFALRAGFLGSSTPSHERLFTKDFHIFREREREREREVFVNMTVRREEEGS